MYHLGETAKRLDEASVKPLFNHYKAKGGERRSNYIGHDQMINIKQINSVLEIDIILIQLVLDMLESEPLSLRSSLKPHADRSANRINCF